MSSDLTSSSETAVTTAHSPSSGSHGHSGHSGLTVTSQGPAEWRPYTYEHPLTAATTAMMAAEDPGSGFGILYDYHYGKMSSAVDVIKSEKTLTADIWSPAVVTNVIIGGGHSKMSNGDMSFSQSSSLQPKGTSVLRRCESKATKLIHNGHRYTNGDSLSPSDHHHSPASSSGGVIIVKEEIAHSPGGSSPRMNGILGVSTPQTPLTPTSVSPTDEHAQYQSPQLFATLSNPTHGSPYDFVSSPTSVVVSSAQFASSLRGGGTSSMANIYPVGTSPSDPYYRVDYFGNEFGASGVTTATRQLSPYDGASDGGPSFVDRYVRQGGPYKTHAGLPVDLPSPDSGIGTEAITPRDHSNVQQGFDYTDLCHPGLISDLGSNGRTTPGPPNQQKSTRPWHDFGRQNEADKIQIPKLFSQYGFRYYLESPISTSQRREDDRITYINKGQFYGITLEYVPDSEKPLKSQTVKTVVMLVFREEKSPEDEIKAWQFWHGRQHSVKQRILDADTKNSVGLAGCIDEIAHNAIAIYWNPLESSAKINVAVQCLSTDFSSQKGVKGLPLHLQIDTYEDPRDPNCPIFHRGYVQIKVFCDKGAERKTRDEERRAAKRKLTATGRKKLDEMYHTSCERSEFYSMSDMNKPPVLFTPAEDLDKLTSLELHGFYSTNSDQGSEHSGGGVVQSHSSEGLQNQENNEGQNTMTLLGQDSPQPHSCGSGGGVSGSSTPAQNHQHSPHHHTQHHSYHHQPATILKFHHSFPPESPPYIRSGHLSSSPTPSPKPTMSNEKKEQQQHQGVVVMNNLDGGNSNGVSNDGVNVFCTSPTSMNKRMRLMPSAAERLMLYVRQETEDAFTPLHLVPPTTLGLLSALEEKYNISVGSVKSLYRRNVKGIVAKIDDEMLKHYCHEDSFQLDVKPSENEDAFDVTLTELMDCHHHS